MHPFDRGVVALFGHAVAAGHANGIIGIVVDFAAGYFGDILIQQADQAANQAGLGLPSLAQQDYVLTGENGVFQLRYYRFLEPDDAGKDDFLGANPVNQVVAYLFADGANHVSALSQVLDGSQGTVISHQQRLQSLEKLPLSPDGTRVN